MITKFYKITDKISKEIFSINSKTFENFKLMSIGLEKRYSVKKNHFRGSNHTMRFLIEQFGEKINLSRDFRRYIIRPELKLAYSFYDDGTLDSKYRYISERLESRDDKDNDLRTFCLIITVGEKLPITIQERKELGTVELN